MLLEAPTLELPTSNPASSRRPRASSSLLSHSRLTHSRVPMSHSHTRTHHSHLSLNQSHARAIYHRTNQLSPVTRANASFTSVDEAKPLISQLPSPQSITPNHQSTATRKPLKTRYRFKILARLFARGESRGRIPKWESFPVPESVAKVTPVSSPPETATGL